MKMCVRPPAPAGGFRKVTRLQATVDGKKVGPEVARGIQVKRRGQTDLVLYGSPEKITSYAGVSFKGRICVISFKENRPVRVAVIDGGPVTCENRVLIRNTSEGLTEKRL